MKRSDVPRRETLVAIGDGKTLYDLVEERGYPMKVLVAWTEQMHQLGYLEWGVVVTRPWLTARGKVFVRGDE